MKETGRKTNNIIFIAILLIGIFARVYRFGSVPGGINQDEAFAAFEALSILRTGADSFGYRFPVYLTAWGSGMNALESYLMIPFIALFGLKTWVIRLPQLIAAILTIPAVYSIMRKVTSEKGALFAVLLLAVCPWHVMLSRWGLESNLAPAFLSFGLCFFFKGLDERKYLPLSALFYGLSLYAYATLWIVLPFMLLAQVIYAIYAGKLGFNAASVNAFAVLAVLALPLILFVAVNCGLIGEVKTWFISIPRLLYMRAGEISFASIPENAKNLFDIIASQSDGLSWNNAEKYGIIYPISMPFAVIGLISAVVSAIRKMKAHACSHELPILIWLIFGILVGLLIKVNINRVNLLFIPLVLMISLGIECVASGIGKRGMAIFAAVYLILFIGFESYYFSDYADRIAGSFGSGLEEALDAAPEDETVFVSSYISYPKILFYTEYPVEEYAETVEYTNYPSAFLSVKRFGRFEFVSGVTSPDGEHAYILSRYDDRAPFTDAGYTIEVFGNTYLALPKK